GVSEPPLDFGLGPLGGLSIYRGGLFFGLGNYLGGIQPGFAQDLIGLLLSLLIGLRSAGIRSRLLFALPCPGAIDVDNPKRMGRGNYFQVEVINMVPALACFDEHVAQTL